MGASLETGPHGAEASVGFRRLTGRVVGLVVAAAECGGHRWAAADGLAHTLLAAFAKPTRAKLAGTALADLADRARGIAAAVGAIGDLDALALAVAALVVGALVGIVTIGRLLALLATTALNRGVRAQLVFADVARAEILVVAFSVGNAALATAAAATDGAVEADPLAAGVERAVVIVVATGRVFAADATLNIGVHTAGIDAAVFGASLLIVAVGVLAALDLAALLLLVGALALFAASDKALSHRLAVCGHRALHAAAYLIVLARTAAAAVGGAFVAIFAFHWRAARFAPRLIDVLTFTVETAIRRTRLLVIAVAWALAAATAIDWLADAEVTRAGVLGAKVAIVAVFLLFAGLAVGLQLVDALPAFASVVGAGVIVPAL